MINAIKSETIKLLSLRSTWIYAILLTGALYGPVALISFFSQSEAPADWETVTAGGMIFCTIAIVFMGSTIANELETRMYAHAFLTQNSRSLWLTARYLVNAIFLALCYLVGTTLAFVPLFDTGFTATATPYLYITLGTTGIFTLIAAGVAVVSRLKIAAVSIPLLWLLVIDQLVAASARRIPVMETVWLLSPAPRAAQIGNWLGNVNAPVGWGLEAQQPALFNIAVLLLWAAVAVGAAYVVNARRDV